MNRFLLTLIFFAGGCLSSSGTSCHIDSDCDSGLVCTFSGVCTAPEEVDLTSNHVSDIGQQATQHFPNTLVAFEGMVLDLLDE